MGSCTQSRSSELSNTPCARARGGLSRDSRADQAGDGKSLPLLNFCRPPAEVRRPGDSKYILYDRPPYGKYIVILWRETKAAQSRYKGTFGHSGCLDLELSDKNSEILLSKSCIPPLQTILSKRYVSMILLHWKYWYALARSLKNQHYIVFQRICFTAQSSHDLPAVAWA